MNTNKIIEPFVWSYAMFKQHFGESYKVQLDDTSEFHLFQLPQNRQHRNFLLVNGNLNADVDVDGNCIMNLQTNFSHARNGFNLIRGETRAFKGYQIAK